MITSKEFLEKLESVEKLNTIYMKGCFGQKVTNELIAEKKKQFPSWYKAEKLNKFNALVGKNYYGFDCIGLIKGVLFWNFGTPNFKYNSKYDYNELELINMCNNVSTDLSKVKNGELLYMKGHCGIVFDADKKLCIECTTGGTGNVQIRPIAKQKWEKRGELPQIEYVVENKTLYRVRVAWLDDSSQIGAYESLEIAKSNCKDGYSVFDDKGNVVFSNKPVCPYKEPTETLYKGCKSESVKWVQWYLVKTGFMRDKLDNGKDSVDGSWGNTTEKAFSKFQLYYPNTGKYNKFANRYEPDGRCGTNARAKLKSLL